MIINSKYIFFAERVCKACANNNYSGVFNGLQFTITQVLKLSLIITTFVTDDLLAYKKARA